MESDRPLVGSRRLYRMDADELRREIENTKLYFRELLNVQIDILVNKRRPFLYARYEEIWYKERGSTLPGRILKRISEKYGNYYDIGFDTIIGEETIKCVPEKNIKPWK